MNNKKIIAMILVLLLSTSTGFCDSLAQEKKDDVSVKHEESTVSGTSSEKPATQEAPVEKVAPQATQTATAEEKQPEEAAMVTPGNVTVNFKGADIKTVLAYLAEVSGVDIVPAPDVKGIVDLKLTNKPWKVALDIIVRNYGFAYEREGDIIRVVTVDKLKQEELASQVFGLNYSKGKEVVASIKDIVSERGKVMYDERTNTVLVTDIPTNLYKIGQIIERLDKKTYQVLIEARVIETVLDNNEKLGIDWNLKFTASGARRPTTLPFENFRAVELSPDFFPQVQTQNPSTAVAGGSGAVGTTTASDFPSSRNGPVAFPFAAKDQFTFGTLDFSEFKMVMEAIKQRANTDIVSNPTIATLNNSEALINVGTTLNLPKYERNSSTGKMEITGYDAKDLGIILKVTPHVNDNGEIVVDLAPEISDLLRYDTLDAASGVVAPVFSARQAKTKVMIKDGDTIFIGGLIKENDVENKTKMPFLGDMFGDVPYLGLLFTHKGTTKQKSELIFFITVNLMAPGKEIKNVPLASKAYVPMYTLTTEKAASTDSKKKIKK